MDARKQMEWVQRNRGPRSRTTTIQAAVAELAAKLADEAEPLEAAAEALAGIVDEEFRRHCCVSKLSGTTLTIHVDEPAMVSLFRIQWGSRIRRDLPKALGRAIGRVVFVAGCGGTPIGGEKFSN
jgi:hypothetical protein